MAAATILKSMKSPRFTRDEGMLTRRVEYQTSRVPSAFWLACAGGSIAAAIGLRVSGRTSDANFVGQWAPMFMMVGIYNKIVKLLGHD